MPRPVGYFQGTYRNKSIVVQTLAQIKAKIDELKAQEGGNTRRIDELKAEKDALVKQASNAARQ